MVATEKDVHKEVERLKEGREEMEGETRQGGMEMMDGNLKKKMVWAVTRLLSLLLFGSEML